MVQLKLSLTVAAFTCFAGIILLPRGVGFLGGAALPVQRIPIVLLFLVLLLFVFRNQGRIKVPCKHTLIAICLAILGYSFSALVSASGARSLAWVIQFSFVYMGVGFALLVIVGGEARKERVYLLLRCVALALALWSAFEYVSQEKLFSTRSIYDATGAAYSINLRRLLEDGGQTLYSSLGPFASNLPLAGILCSFAGSIVISASQSPLRYALGASLLSYSVLSTQSRAGLLGLVFIVSMLIYIVHTRRLKLSVFTGAVSGMVLFLFTHGPQVALLSIFGSAAHNPGGLLLGVLLLPLFLGVVYFMRNRYFPLVVLVGVVVGVFYLTFNSDLVAYDHTGGAYARLYGMKVFLSQPGSLLFGVGPGGFFDSERIITTTEIYSDQGSFFTFLGEGGIVVGGALLYMVYRSVRIGIFSSDRYVQALAISLSGSFFTALVSTTPDPWIVIVLLCGLIESWSKSDRSRVQPVNRIVGSKNEFLPTNGNQC